MTTNPTTSSNRARQLVPLPQAAPAQPGATLGASLSDQAAYDQGVQNIMLLIGGGILIFLILRSDFSRGFYSGKGKGITNEEALTRLVAIAGIYYFWRQQQQSA